jgi:hypothetical protein
MALRQASAKRSGSRGAPAGNGRAGCDARFEVLRSFLSTLEAKFFGSRRPALKPIFSGTVRTVAWNAARGCGCRSRPARRATPQRLPGRKWTCTSSPQSVGGPPGRRDTQILRATGNPGVETNHHQRCTFRPPRAALFNRRSQRSRIAELSSWRAIAASVEELKDFQESLDDPPFQTAAFGGGTSSSFIRIRSTML